MYVCLCKAISDKDLNKILKDCGPEDPVEFLKRKLGLGKDCGSCLEQALKMAMANFQKGA